MPARAVLIAALAAPLAALADASPQEALIGSWTTPLAEQSAGGSSAHVRERIVFGPATNTVSIEAFADEAGTVPLFTYASTGPYEITGPSEAVPGAWMLDARNSASTFTVFAPAPEVWAALNLGGCAFETGVPLEIAGCVAGPPFNAARCLELDLVHVKGDALRLGARDVDRCETRPDALGETLYRRE